MNLKKNWLRTLVVLLGLAVSAWLFGDWFKSPPLTIFHRVIAGRPQWGAARPGNNQPPDAPVVTFGFDRKLKLTDVKVFLLPELETNKLPQPIWHLVADTNAVPVKGFAYGERIRGLKPFVKGSRPVPLEITNTYRLLIEAGSLRGQHDFGLGEKKTVVSN